MVVQRVTEASVETEGVTVGKIDRGLLILLGIRKGDSPSDADFLARRAVGLRIFPDANGKMNRNVNEAGGALLVVSQFTLYGTCTKGLRPGFEAAAAPEEARILYEHFVTCAKETGIRVETGKFQAFMRVNLVNDGPVTLICDTNQGLTNLIL